MNDTKDNKPRNLADDWIGMVVAVGVPLLATMADPVVTLTVTLGLMLALAVYYRIRSPFRFSWMLPVAGAAVLLAALVVLLTRQKH